MGWSLPGSGLFVFMEENKLDNIMKNIGYAVVTIAVVILIFYIISLDNKGVASCTSSFINQKMSASDVKRDCPNLTKDDLVQALIDADNLTREERDFLLVDITENY